MATTSNNPNTPSDQNDGRYWPQIGGVPFDPRDVEARERLFAESLEDEQVK